MKMLIVLVCHNRQNCLDDWLRAWRYTDRTDAVLYVVSTGPITQPEPMPPDAKFLKMPNEGLDIGVIQRLINQPPEPYHLLMWFPDDFLPMRGDFPSLYRAQFASPSVGLCGTFWGINHIRSGGVCVRRELAEKLQFPPDLLNGGTWEQQRNRCLAFEHGTLNFWNQVRPNGFEPRLVDGSAPPASPDWRSYAQQFVIWDRGMHSRQMWELFDLTFPDVQPWHQEFSEQLFPVAFRHDVTALTIAHAHPAMLEHHLQAYADNGKPRRHVLWINGHDDALWDVAQKFRDTTAIIRTPNVDYHVPADVVAELCTTPYLFIMPSDFRVTRPTWMDEFAALLPADAVGIPGACSRSVNGCLSWPAAGEPWACPPHLRSGGLLVNVAAFKAAGKFGQDGKVLTWQEVRLSRRMLAMGMTVKVIDDAPIYDYGHWGRNHRKNISHGTLDELKSFDAKHGVKAQATTY